jgi:hypothetical protein
MERGGSKSPRFSYFLPQLKPKRQFFAIIYGRKPIWDKKTLRQNKKWFF